MARSTQADLEIALGGGAPLAQLLDKDGDGLPDEAWISTLREWACAELDGYIRKAVPPASLSAPYPVMLVRAEATIAAYLAWLHAPSGLAMPDNIRAAYTDMVSWAKDVGSGDATLDGEEPASTLSPGAVNLHRPGGWARGNFGGFC